MALYIFIRKESKKWQRKTKIEVCARLPFHRADFLKRCHISAALEKYTPHFGVKKPNEDTDIEGMERSCTISGEKRTMVFFCEPNRSDQKGSCEVNHRLLRRIIPKKTSYKDSRNMSIHGLKQYHLTLVTNHINSYARPDMNYIRPYDTAWQSLPEEFFDSLGLETIPIQEVILKPSLIYQ